jgi:hypothetical protein
MMFKARRPCILFFLSAFVFAVLGVPSISGAAEENLADNPGFEGGVTEDGDAIAWSFFSNKKPNRAVVTDHKRSGEHSLKLTGLGAPKGFQGANTSVPVTPGKRYSFSAFVNNSKADTLGGSAHGMLVIEWLRADNQEISRCMSKMYTTSLSRMRWESLAISREEAPEGAVRGIFGIHLCEGEKGATGSVYIDDVMIVED